MHFDIKESETYAYIMQYPNTAKWAKIIKKKLDQLCKNEISELVYKNDIEPDYWSLGAKWVYKIKCNVDGNIAFFKVK